MVEQLGHQNVPVTIGGEEQGQTLGLQHVPAWQLIPSW